METNKENKIRQLENEINLLVREKEESSAKFYDLYNKMEEEVRRRSSLIQGQNFKLQEEVKKRKTVEIHLQKALVEKDFYFRELHHRVKDNLQLMYSIMNLQIKDSRHKEAKKVLQASQQKMHAMAMVHDFIYENKCSDTIDLSKYLTFLSKEIYRNNVVHFSMRKLTLNIEPDIAAPLKISLPCGLILNELITNSIKYAFNQEKFGEITVTLKQNNENFILEVIDNGVGIDEGKLYCNNCLGLNLVKLLTESQLKGNLIYKNYKGSSFCITIPNKTESL